MCVCLYHISTMEEFNLDIFTVNTTITSVTTLYSHLSTSAIFFYSGLDCKEISVKLGYTLHMKQ